MRREIRAGSWLGRGSDLGSDFVPVFAPIRAPILAPILASLVVPLAPVIRIAPTVTLSRKQTAT